MLNNMSIKNKNLLILSMLGGIISLILISSIVSINKILDNSDAINIGKEKIIKNKEIEAIHEKYIGNFCRSVFENKQFNGTTDDRSCILGNWFFPFQQTKEYQNLSSDLKSKFNLMVDSHKFIHETAKDYEENYIHLDRKFAEFLYKKEIEHLNWINNISKNLIEKKIVIAQTNPKKCNFGKWYYNFINSNDFNDKLNRKLQNILKEMENPHKKLHNSVKRIIALQKQGKHSEATNYFKKNTLSILKDLQFLFHEISIEIENIEKHNKKIEDKITYEIPTKFKDVIIALDSYEKYLLIEEENLLKSNESAINIIITVFIILSILAIGFIIFGFLVSNSIVKNIKEFGEDLQQFFNYLNRENKNLPKIRINGKDEIGDMATKVDKTVQCISRGIEKDNQLIENTINVVDKVKNGFLGYAINGETDNPELTILITQFNSMLKTVKENFDKITETLIVFGKGNYSHKTELNVNGDIASIIQGLNALGLATSEIIAMISNASDKLNQSINTLLHSSQELSDSSNQQAASLEETSASLEEITTTIKQTTNNIIILQKSSKDLENSAKNGKDLVTETTKMMEEINNSTSKITVSIENIEAIAFQTNILSLNAAVEAATAGEAGKGFAVVAQEVRNLATRSAESASEIRNSVGEAKSKTEDGQKISEKMQNEFNILNKQIENSGHLINDIAEASQQQLLGIEDINTAVSKLDTTIQTNANVANEVNALSKDISELVQNLKSISDKIEYIKDCKNWVCNGEMVLETTKLKLDHISFKEKNFNKLGKGENWSVATCQDCNLGKWINKNSNQSFAQGREWDELKSIHSKVHTGVQNYVNEDSKNSPNNVLNQIAKEIEDSTTGVFNALDKIKQIDCK